ncbi:MAG: glycogen debranching protein GlgX, partial [Mycobacteriaceae bacterium]
ATPSGQPDLMWFGADGNELTDEDWHDSSQHTLQMWIDGSDVRSHTRTGVQLNDSSWLLVLHNGPDTDVTLADVGHLELALDTGTATGRPETALHLSGGSTVQLRECTLWALRAR